MSSLSVVMLGCMRVITDDATLARFDYDKVGALLAYLMVEPSAPISRHKLAGMLWPDMPERTARQSLSQALYTLRKAIGDYTAAPPYLLITPQAIHFNRDSDYDLDVHRFETALRAIRAHGHPEAPLCDACVDRLEVAAALYGGDFLEGFSLPDGSGFEEWLTLQRERIQYQALSLLDWLTEALTARQVYDRALSYARRQLALDAWRESAHRQVMRLLTMAGQRTAALAHYEHCRRILRQELGVAPELATTALFRAIKTGDIGARATLMPLYPTSEPLCDAPIPSNLPTPLTPIVGRDGEVHEVRELLLQPDCRLLTLVGPGGIGKTRLALAAASDVVSDFHVAYVDLTAVTSETDLATAITAALALLFPQAEQQDAGTPSRQRLLTYLETYSHSKPCLLLLDSFEHHLSSSSLLGDLLHASSSLSILVTSRIRLNFLGEHIYAVPALTFPDEDVTEVEGKFFNVVQRFAALRLFALYGRWIAPEFRLAAENLPAVARICRLVRGLPLALILAAAWLPVLTPAEIADRIAGFEDGLAATGIDFLAADWGGLPIRHRSMRAVFEQAWCLLSRRERAMLQALAALPGDFTQDTAYAAAGTSLVDLRTLMQKSVVYRTSAGRYALPELLRRYAGDVYGADAGDDMAFACHPGQVSP